MLSASSGLGSCMYATTPLPKSFGSAVANTRKSGIVFTWITAYGRRMCRAVSVAAVSTKNDA